jgi:DNA-binding transcriptional LysR family regulator
VTLTDAGEEFIFYAKRILNELDQVQASMSRYAERTKGRIRIGVLWGFDYLGIPENIYGYQRAYPEIETRILINGSSNLLEMLLEREIDAAYLIATNKDLEHPEISFQKIMESNMDVVIPCNNPLAEKEKLSFSDLENENIIMTSPDSTLYKPLMGHFYACGITPHIICESAQSNVAMACATSGVGIAFASHSIAIALANERVVVRPIEPVIRRSVYYATLRNTQSIASVRSLTDYVIQSYGYQSS